VAWVDGQLLELVHGLLFRVVHSTVDPPQAAAGGGGDGAA
jgi:hypothetical protein